MVSSSTISTFPRPPSTPRYLLEISVRIRFYGLVVDEKCTKIRGLRTVTLATHQPLFPAYGIGDLALAIGQDSHQNMSQRDQANCDKLAKINNVYGSTNHMCFNKALSAQKRVSHRQPFPSHGHRVEVANG